MNDKAKILVITDSDRVATKMKELLSESYDAIQGVSFDLSPFVDCGIFFEYIIVDFSFFKDFQVKKLEKSFYEKKIKLIKEVYPHSKLFLLADHRSKSEAGSILKVGFQQILTFPLVKEILLQVFELEHQRTQLRAVVFDVQKNIIPPKNMFETQNKDFAKILERIKIVAPTKSTILITGESGTGKSLLAKYIHTLSNRKKDGFISVHCGAIPESLIESELFGHEKGSFTGAIKRKIGKFELANEGSIFLDEVGTVSKGVQVRLLQVLQERFIQRVGGEANIDLDVRILAATNSNLAELVASGEFREDLFYRLNVFPVEIPPLRSRIDDIPILCKHLLNKYNALYNKEINAICPEVFDIFSRYSWPGNIRELENIMERAYILESSNIITVDNVPKELIPANKEMLNISPLMRKSISLAEGRKEVIEAFEKKYLADLMISHHGKVSRAANEAQVTVRQLHKLLAKHRINTKSFINVGLEL